jgi:hypothetical protein
MRIRILLAVASGCASALACAHRASTPAPPLRHCFRIAALGANGGAAVYESGAPGFVEGARADAAYHLELRPGDTVTTLPQHACLAERVCGAEGELRPAVLGLEEKEDFRLAETGAPGAVELELPGMGSRRAALELQPDRFGGREWSIALHATPEPWVLWRAPEALAPIRARWYRAGPRLYVELESASPGMACVVAWADLPRASAGMLDRDARARLREGRPVEAEALLRRAVEIAPEDASAAYNLACAVARQSRPDEALRWLARALLLDDGRRLTALARKDPDFASLRDRDDFRLLVGDR